MNILRFQRSASLVAYHVLCLEGEAWVSRLFAEALPDAFDYHLDQKRTLELSMLRNYFPPEDMGKQLKFRIKIKKQYTYGQIGPFAGYVGPLEVIEPEEGVTFGSQEIAVNLFWNTGTGVVDVDIYRREYDDYNWGTAGFLDVFVRHETGSLSLAALLVERAKAIARLKIIIRDRRVDCELIFPNWKSAATIETRSATAVAPETVDRGAWDREAAYEVNDRVTYQDAVYYSIVRSKGKAPGNTFYWSRTAPVGFRLTDKRSQVVSGQKMLDQLYLFKDGTGCYGAFGNTEEHDWRVRTVHPMPPAYFDTRFDTGDLNIPFIGAGAPTTHFSGGGFYLAPNIINGNFEAAYQLNVHGYDVLPEFANLVPVSIVVSGGQSVKSGGKQVTTP